MMLAAEKKRAGLGTIGEALFPTLGSVFGVHCLFSVCPQPHHTANSVVVSEFGLGCCMSKDFLTTDESCQQESDHPE